MADETKQEAIKTEEKPEQAITKHTTGIIERATAAAERLEKANAELKELVERQEKLKSLDILGGKSSAGQLPPIIDQKEITRADCMKLVEGTGNDPFRGAGKKAL